MNFVSDCVFLSYHLMNKSESKNDSEALERMQEEKERGSHAK